MFRRSYALLQHCYKLRRSKEAVFGLIILSILILLSAVIPSLSSHTYFTTNLSLKNQPPSAAFWFGTDEIGRDLFVRCFLGTRVSLFVGVSAAVIDMVIGVLYGTLAGMFGGRLDGFMMRFADILHSLPHLLITILLTVVMGPGIGTIIIAMTITGWILMARIVRAKVLQTKNLDFVLATIALGASKRRVIFSHLIPNASGSIIATMTLSIPAAIFTEAFLSFLGLGIQAPVASLGSMANDGLSALRYYPWRLLFPGMLITLIIFAFNLIGDALQDTFDPKIL